jgi:adenosylcobinamide-GDP ribazoletransferase
VHSLKVALIFLTRLPVPFDGRADPVELARSVAWFPLVGALVGLAGGAAYGLAATAGLPPHLAALPALAATILLTGALHEDGLADSADGLGGRDPERRLLIMRDSRIGSYGTIALALALLARAGAIAALATPQAVTAALIVAGAVSRACLPVVITLMPPAAADGLAAAAGRPEPWRALLAVALAIALSLALLPLAAASLALAAAALAGGAVALGARRRLGGHTGDSLGAVQQLAEIAILLALVAAW